MSKKESTLFALSVNVFFYEGTNLNTTVFTSPTGDGAATLSDHQSHAKVQSLAVQSLHFSVILRP